MVATTLAVQGVLQLAIAATFVFVAQTIRSWSPTTPDGRLAARAFLGWWVGFAVYIGVLGSLALVASSGRAPYALFLAARLASVPFLAMALWGMATYVLVMYTGNLRVARYVAVYAAGLVVLFWTETLLDTDGTVAVGTWTASLATTNHVFLNLVYAYFAVPLIASIVAYAGLFRRTTGAEKRYRIVLVSSSLGTWVVGGFIGQTSGDGLAAFATVTAFGLACSLALLAAYRPPRAVKRALEARDERAALRW
jgi:hypothetical protein